MSGLNGLTLAVPRGALMGDTLNLLDQLGADTAEVRANDRKLLFEDAGLVTMRPSDVPTYVEAGAADLGIAGKDVLAEQSERAVYEVYDAALGAPLGGGGRYDDLLGRFGRDLPAAGWALNVERLHIALVGERRGERL